MPQGSVTTTLQIANGYVSSSVGLGDLPVELAVGNSAAGQTASMSGLRYTQTALQQGTKRVGTGAVGNAYQGTSVALSADGNTMAVGGTDDNSNAGAVWIFTRSGTTWSQQGSKLVGTGASGAAFQGASVALSADGNTLAIGGPTDNTNRGAVWIFTRSGSTWTQQGSKLVGTGGAGATSRQGSAVDLSADGNTLVIGAPTDDSNIGSVWIFTRSGTTWTQQGSKLQGTGASTPGINGRRLGGSISVSADGNTLAAGATGDNNEVGATWVFTRSGTTWSQQAKLVGTGATGSSYQGNAVSLSANGNTLAIGGPADNNNRGAIWVFTRSGTTWTQQGSKIIGTSATNAPDLGLSVALSADGNVMVAGGPFAFNAFGRVWLFTRTNTTWTQQAGDIYVTDAAGLSAQLFGISVAISGNGNTFAVGSSGDNSGVGATWAFV